MKTQKQLDIQKKIVDSLSGKDVLVEIKELEDVFTKRELAEKLQHYIGQLIASRQTVQRLKYKGD